MRRWRGWTQLGQGFGKLWSAASLSNLGDGVYIPAIALLAADQTRDPLLVSLVTAAAWVPWLMVGPLSGALVDRWDRRRVMWSTDTFRALLMVFLMFGVLTDRVGIASVIIVAFGLGLAETLFDSASQAMIPMVVGRERGRLNKANGLFRASELIGSRFGGPPLGGLLYGWMPWIPFLVDAISFGGSAGIIGSLRGRFSDGTTADRPSLRTDVFEGLAFTLRHPLLRAIAIFGALANLALTAGSSIVVLFAQEILGLDEIGFGFLTTGAAAGGLIGILGATRLGTETSVGVIFLVGVTTSGLAQLALGFTSDPIVAWVLLAVGAAGVAWTSVLVQTLRQEITPDRLLGRVVGSQRMLSLGAIPFGAVGGGLLARAYGLPSPFILGGAALVVTGLGMYPIFRTASAPPG